MVELHGLHNINCLQIKLIIFTYGLHSRNSFSNYFRNALCTNGNWRISRAYVCLYVLGNLGHRQERGTALMHVTMTAKPWISGQGTGNSSAAAHAEWHSKCQVLSILCKSQSGPFTRLGTQLLYEFFLTLPLMQLVILRC